MQTSTRTGQYALATGQPAVRRLHMLHRVCSPAGRRVLLQAGLGPGMEVADFGCGIGMVTRMMAEIVGNSGNVVGIDVSGAQLEQARRISEAEGIDNVTFVEASAYATGLPRNSFDLVYCRFLLLHLTDAPAALREMREVLKPGGMLVVEDGNLMSAGSIPPSSLQAFSEMCGRLGPLRGLNYGMADNLFHLVQAAGFPEPEVEFHQPVIARGEDRMIVQLSLKEFGPALLDAGLLNAAELETVLADMERDTNNPEILVMGPRMCLVWARKSTP